MLETSKILVVVTTHSDVSLSYFTQLTDSTDLKVYEVFYGEIIDEKLPEACDYIYFRDPFNTGSFDLAVIKHDVEAIIDRYPKAYSIDNIKSITDLLFEDKWIQYKKLKKFMPQTYELTSLDQIDQDHIAKKKISSRARGIAFTQGDIKSALSDYIVQERLEIDEEYRVYVVCKEVMPHAALRSSKTLHTAVKVKDYIRVTDRVLTFAQEIAEQLPGLDFYGLDIAMVKGQVKLLEVNRSCQFVRYNQFGNLNLALKLHTALMAREKLSTPTNKSLY